MKFNPLKERMRATFAAGSTVEPRVESVDREREVLHGIQITLEGEAKGHGVWLDRAFCEAVVEAGNAMGDAGVKCRFGHPAMCSDALGTYLGRCKRFRVGEVTRKESGEKACGVFADLEIAPESHSAPGGDLGKWVMEAAENSPDQFGQSIVFTYGDLKSTNAEGNPILRSEFDSAADFDAARGENKIFAVLGKLLGSDFTDSPAATDGVFAQASLAAEAEEMLEAHPEIVETISKNPSKVVEFLDRVGLLGCLETARVSGLQSAKDKTIAELREIEKTLNAALTAKDAELDGLKAQLAALEETAAAAKANADARAAEIETFKNDVAEKAAALETAASELERLRAAHGETERALAETQAALEVEINRYRAQVAGALAPAEDLPTMKEGLAKCATPAEKSAFIASGKYRKN